jgi:hypothetical protein
VDDYVLTGGCSGQNQAFAMHVRGFDAAAQRKSLETVHFVFVAARQNNV